MLEQCINFRRIFDEKLTFGEILSQVTDNINFLSFPKHSYKSKGQVMMTSHKH